MNGRMELAEKDWKKVDNELKFSPSYLKDYVLAQKAAKKSGKTVYIYVRIIYNYLASLKEAPYLVELSELTTSSIRNYLIEHQTKENANGEVEQVSFSYMNGFWTALNSFFSFLYNEEYIDYNPMERIKRPGGSDEARINEHRILLTKKDFSKILKSVETGAGSNKAKCRQSHLKNRDRLIMYIFMSTGLRESALISINLDDIDTEENVLTIYDKGDIYHTFKLSDQVMETFFLWLKDREQYANNTSALFVSERGNRISTCALNAVVGKYTKEALGKELSPHKLRAGVCSILYKETKDIEFVRRFIGHSDVSITQRYIVTGKEEIEKGKDILSSIF